MKSTNSKANTWHPYQGPIKPWTVNMRYQGSESRQVLRRKLRKSYGCEPGKRESRNMMGLPHDFKALKLKVQACK